jgi:hypothetical protein
LVTLDIITAALVRKKDPSAHLAAAVFAKYPDKDKLGRRLGLIERFMLKMKAGDVVIMPNPGGERYAFGEVTADAPFEVGGDSFDDNDIYRKRRRVNWIRRSTWVELDPKLYYALRAPQALTKLNDYAEYLDRTMYAIYIKGGETHVRLDIKTEGGIDGDDYFDMGHSLLSLCRDFKCEVGMPERGNKIEVRSNVQSPGIFEFITQDPILAGFLACVLTVAFFGGHAKADKLGLSIGTDGLLKGITNFLMEGKKRALLEDLRGNLGAMEANVAADTVLRLTGTSPSSPSAPPTVSPPTTLPQALPPPAADPST